MPFCTECGKKLKADSKFCGECGKSRADENNPPETHIKNNLKKDRAPKFPLIYTLIILLLIYAVFDFWAIGQLEVAVSLDSIIASASNFDLQTGPTSSSASTTIRITNPTIIPVIAGQISFDASYGDTKFADGSTDLIIIMPNSYNDIPAHVRLSYIGTGAAAVEGLIDLITQKTKPLRLITYAGFGPIKIYLRG